MNRMDSGLFACKGLCISLGLAFAAVISLEATESHLVFPPLKETSNDASTTTESLKFPPLPFESSVSTSTISETENAQPAVSVSGADILSSVVGRDNNAPSVLEGLPGLPGSSKASQETGNSVSSVLAATTAPVTNGPSALSALASAIAELPPTSTNEVPAVDETVVSVPPKRSRPPRPAESVAPESGVETTNGIVRVSVFIDVPFEEIKYPEGTAMLRTKSWLRQSFPGLPDQFSVNGRVIENGFDDEDRVYRYMTEYRLADINQLIPSTSADDPQTTEPTP